MFREDQRIEGFIAAREGTMNDFASRSAAKMLLRLKQVYPQVLTDQIYNAFMADLKAYVGQEDAAKLYAIAQFEFHANQPVNMLDKATVYLPKVNEQGDTGYVDEQYIFTLKEVMSLVGAALTDESKYEYSLSLMATGTDEEKRKVQQSDRISNLLQALITVQNGICHHGIRHELVFILNGAYSFDGVNPHYLMQDEVLSIILLIRDGIAKAYKEKMATANDAEKSAIHTQMICWLTNGNPSPAMKVLGIESSLRVDIEKLFIENGVNPWKKGTADTLTALMQQVEFESASCYPDIFSEFKRLFDLLPYNHEPATAALDKMQEWAEIQCNINDAGDLKRVQLFNKIYKLADTVKRNYAYFKMTDSTLTARFNGLCLEYFTEVVDRISPPLVASAELSDAGENIQQKIAAFKLDKMNLIITNLLANWFSATTVPDGTNYETLMTIYKIFLSEEMLAKIFITDAELRSLINNDNSMDLDPYYINRLFFHAMFKPVGEWTDNFFEAFSETLQFVKNSFNQSENGLNAQLIATSYPEVLLTQLTYLQQLRAGNQTNYPAYNIILPQQVKTIEDVINVGTWLNDDDAMIQYLKFKPIFNAILVRSARDDVKMSEVNRIILYRFACENPVLLIHDTSDIVHFIKLFQEYGTTQDRNFLFLKLIACIQPGWFTDQVHLDTSRSLMHVAAVLCTPIVMKALIAKGGDVNFITTRNVSPLMMAAKFNDGAMITCLVVAKANVNQVDKSGNTIVHYAVHNKRLDVLPVLLNAGARMNQPNYKNTLPVSNAVLRGILLNLKPKNLTSFNGVLDYLSLTDPNGCRIIYTAHHQKLDSLIPKTVSHLMQLPKIINRLFLIKYCADITLDFALLHELILKVYDGKVSNSDFNDIVIKCLDAGMGVNAKNKEGCFLLMLAVINKNNQLLERLLLDKNIDINAVGRNLNTALHIAAHDNNIEAIKQLITYGAALQVKNAAGVTPVECFPPNGSPIIRALLSGEVEDCAANRLFSARSSPLTVSRPNIATEMQPRRIGLSIPR